MSGGDAASFIRAHLPVEPVAGIPEIRLHRAMATSGLHRLAATDEAGFGAPYWAYPWAGGLALARYLLDHPEHVAGRHVLDLGAGGGLVAIAAARAGATTIIAAEVDHYAAAALRLNLALNGVRATIVEHDLTAGPPPAAIDLVLVGDLFYAPDLATHVTGFLDRCRSAGIAVLVGDPWRAHLPYERLRELARYEVAESGSTLKWSGVFAFGQAHAVSPDIR